MTAVDELMQHCRQIGLRRSRLMSRFYRFHRKNPTLLDFLLQELVTLAQNNWPTTSFEMLWHHARWVLTYRRVSGESFSVCQNLMPHYSRLAIILFPEFNSFYRLKSAKADKDFGVRIAPTKNGEEFRRLEWADGTPIESGWKPSASYVSPSNSVPRRAPVLRTVFTPDDSRQHERTDRNDEPHSATVEN
jgi:hypothetical protein